MGIYIDRNGQRLGPYPLDQVNQCLEQGSLLPTDSAWHDGMTDWVPLNQINGVIIPGESPAPPPPPAGTPSAPPSVIEGSTCPACQAPINSGQAFCMGCGANLESGQAPTLQTTTQSAGKKKLLIGVGAGVGVLALAAVGFFVIYPKLSGDGTNQESSETAPDPSNEQKAKMDPPLPDDIPSLKAFLEPGANQLSAAHKTKAQYKLGKLLLEKGHEAGSDDVKDKVKADALYREAVKYLTAAAEGGHAGAQYALGQHFSSEKELIVDGRKVGLTPRYYGKAYDTRHKWYIMPAEQGHRSAAFSLAYDIIKGKTSTTSPEERLSEAIKWLTVAAENGHPGTAYLIGECYYLSRLRESAFISDFELHKIIMAKREPKKACVWFSIASKRKFNIELDKWMHKYAAEDIESLLKKGLLTQQQIDEADALAEKMIKDNPKLIERFTEE